MQRSFVTFSEARLPVKKRQFVERKFLRTSGGWLTPTRVLLNTESDPSHNLSFSKLWMCVKPECRAINEGRLRTCKACGESKPLPGGWVCIGCQTKNFRGVKTCKGCTAPASKTVDHYWTCISCSKNNKIDPIDDNFKCGYCGYDMAPPSKSEEEIMQELNKRHMKVVEEQVQYDSAKSGDFPELEQASESNKPADPKVIHKFVYSPTTASRHTRMGRKPFEFSKEVTKPGGFPWMCRETSCGTLNSGDTMFCVSCKTKIEPGEWDCSMCAAKNHWTRSRCFSCQEAIYPSWSCLSCQSKTSLYDSVCRKCGNSRPPIVPKPIDSTRRSAPFRHTRVDWLCSGCGTKNFGFRTQCFSCDAPKPGSAAAPDSPSYDSTEAPKNVNENNWNCKKCGVGNFRTRVDCWQCGQAATGMAAATAQSEKESAPSIAKEGFQEATAVEGETPVALLKTWGGAMPSGLASDWTCTKCFSQNFKNRSECFKCGAAQANSGISRRILKKPVKL